MTDKEIEDLWNDNEYEEGDDYDGYLQPNTKPKGQPEKQSNNILQSKVQQETLSYKKQGVGELIESGAPQGQSNYKKQYKPKKDNTYNNNKNYEDSGKPKFYNNNSNFNQNNLNNNKKEDYTLNKPTFVQREGLKVDINVDSSKEIGRAHV